MGNNVKRVENVQKDLVKLVDGYTSEIYPDRSIFTDKERNVFLACINTNLTEISLTLAVMADILSEIKGSLMDKVEELEGSDSY